MLVTANGGRAAVGTELCPYTTSQAERDAILEREARVQAWRRTLPRRKRPEHELPGPLVYIQLSH